MSPVLRASLGVLLLVVTVYGQNPEPKLAVTATNALNFVYIDNVAMTPLPNNTNWQAVDRVSFDPDARLIAIRANNILDGCSGLMVASFDHPHPIVSDRTWKCSNSPGNGWQFLGFDDSTWDTAVEIAQNGEILTGCPWFIIQDMPTTAYWIWTNAFVDGDQIVSCRGYTSVCDGATCQNGGTCNMDRFELCTCPVRWGGKYCQLEIDECESEPCQNGGRCELDDSGYKCQCQLGFTGVNCETDTTDCASQPCQNGGTCNFDIDGGYTCTCMPGYSGLDCETDTDECLSGPCLNGATCIDRVNSITCLCVPGFTGLFCQNNINECQSNPCLSASTCEDLVNGYRCNCHSGYTGDHCETAIGFCESDPCQNGGTCTLGGPGGAIQCICTPGWSGPLCSSNENECLSDPCKNGGTCIDGDGEYECYCDDSYHGPNCESVVPNCGSIMDPSGRPPTNRFSILCQIDIINHASSVSVPCKDLIKGINHFEDADAILAQGGNFGCYVTKFPDEINSACVDNYNHNVPLNSCLSCSVMGVCLRLPDPSMKSNPLKK